LPLSVGSFEELDKALGISYDTARLLKRDGRNVFIQLRMEFVAALLSITGWIIGENFSFVSPNIDASNYIASSGTSLRIASAKCSKKVIHNSACGVPESSSSS
jgi:hypothetical protein